MENSEYEIIRVENSGWRIEDDTVRFFLFTGKERALLVDSGKTVENALEIVRMLTDLPVILVNTHSDPDHIVCNQQFEEIYMHPSEIPVYRNLHGRTEHVKPVWDGDVIDLGGRHFEIIHTPGHTPGSISLLDREQRVLIGGDGIQDGKIYLFGKERSLTAYLYMLQRLEKRKAEFDYVYPSHGSFPVKTELIGDLIAGVEKLFAGKIAPGGEGEYMGTSFRAYDIGAAVILCDDRGLIY